MRDKIQASLFGVYRAGSRMGFGVRQRISPFGRILLVMWPLVGFLTMMYPRESFFRILGVTTAMVIVAFVSAIFRRCSLHVVRHLPRYGTVGEKLFYSVEYENRSKWKLTNFLLHDRASDPRPSREMFLNSTEPGEHLRNKFDQTFVAYRWMWMMRRRLLMISEPTLAEPIEAGETKSLNLNFQPLRRGVVLLSQLHAVLPDPIGVFQKTRVLQQSTDKVIVLPKRYPFAGIDFDGFSRSQLGGESTSSTSGQSGEFVSLREYRPGDPIKHIHWPSWGKTGKPVIREYEDVFYPRYGLVLDTDVSAEHEFIFEEAVSIAATFASELDTEQSLLDLMFYQQGVHTHTVGKNVERVDKVLEVLAGIEMQVEAEWPSLTRQVLKHSEDLTTCIVLLCSWDQQRKDHVNKLVANGVNVCVLFVVDDKSSDPLVISGCNAASHLISVGNVEAGLSQLALI